MEKIALAFALIGCLIGTVNGAVCVYANCEPVETFLESSVPQIISHCASCSECLHLDFS